MQADLRHRRRRHQCVSRRRFQYGRY
uniref:Uncharacterized protein n=1 Tax=Arundo donax TaxID=35708 RepID=A0A0A9ECK1_ARUDO